MANETFEMGLPRGAPGRDAGTEMRLMPSRFTGAPETVLIVDDEPSVRMLIVEVLEDLGYQALEAEDGPAGLAILESPARIDLLIADMGLPGGMNGRQLAEAARRGRPALNVLFISGYAESAVMADAPNIPGAQVMTKPFALHALGSRIKEIIEG